MLCQTCRWSERPGFVRRPLMSGSGAEVDHGAAVPAAEAVDFIPCPDCGGTAIAHCCEGLCEQPERDAPVTEA